MRVAVHVDLVHRQAGRARDDRLRAHRHLDRTADPHLAVAEVGGAVVRLERRVRHERERVGVVDHDRRRRQRVVDPAGVVQRRRRRRQQLLELLGERRVAFGRVRAFVPLHDERIAALERRPRRIGDHRHARHQERRVVEALDLDDVADAGDLARLGRVDLDRPAVEDRALGDRRELHVRQPHVDAEQRLAGDDLVVVDAVDARADQSIARRILQRHVARHRAASPRAPPACRSALRACLPRWRTTCAAVSHSVAGTLHSAAAAAISNARAVAPMRRSRSQSDRIASLPPTPWPPYFAIERRIVDAHLRPVGVELLGDEHRQRRLRAFAHLRLRRPDQHAIVGIDLDVVGGEAERPGLRRHLHLRAERLGAHRDEQAAGRGEADGDELPAVSLRRCWPTASDGRDPRRSRSSRRADVSSRSHLAPRAVAVVMRGRASHGLPDAHVGAAAADVAVHRRRRSRRLTDSACARAAPRSS